MVNIIITLKKPEIDEQIADFLLLHRIKAPTVGALISYMTTMEGGNATGL